jgi:hypothetical protein
MSQPEKPDRSMMWMGVVMMACCMVPLLIALFLGGGLGVFFGRNTRPTPTTQPTNPTVNPSNQTIPNR